MSDPSSPTTEDRIDLDEFGEALPHSLPSPFRPARFEQVIEQERLAYRRLLRPLRTVRRETFAMLGLTDPGRQATRGARGSPAASLPPVRVARTKQLEWDAYTRQQWNRAIANYLDALQGSTNLTHAEAQWFFSDAALPTEWRLGMEVGIKRAVLLTGADEAATDALGQGVREAFGRDAFARLSDNGRSRLADILTSDTRPGGSVESIIRTGIEDGTNPMTLARELSGQYDHYEKWEFARLTRTEVGFAQEAGLDEELRGEGWAPIPGVRYPPLHPNLSLPGNRVWGTSVLAAFRAWYDGPAVEVAFSDSGRFSVTIHHPILTLRGWVAAGELRQGDYLVCSRRFEGAVLRDPDNDQVPPRIEDVFASAAMARGMASARMPVAPEDLHGDGSFCKGEVDVVRADGLLQDCLPSALPQSLGHQLLQPANAELLALPSASDLQAMLRRLALASDACMGEGGPAPLLLGRNAVQAHALLLLGTAHRHAALSKSRGQVRSCDTGLLRQTVDALSGFVTVEQVLQVRQFRYAGHAYDLQSPATAYILNGVVSSNCVCSRNVDFNTGLITLDVSASACELCQAARINATVAMAEAARRNPFEG